MSVDGEPVDLPMPRGPSAFTAATASNCQSVGQSTASATLIEASTADFWMYPTAFGLAATAFFTAAELGSCFGATPRSVKRIRDQMALICAPSRPVTFL